MKALKTLASIKQHKLKIEKLCFRLKFVIGTSGVNLFISSDMFYLEIIVEASGGIKDVKIHHEGKVRGLIYIFLIIILFILSGNQK